MAVPANTFKTFEAVGIREDLSDIITNISPVDTPFFSGLADGKKPNSTKVEWQTDALAAAGDNAQLEGDDRTAAAITPTARLYNMCQIQSKTFRISDTADEVNAAGRKSEVSYQTAKHMEELAKDIEYAFLRGVRVDGNASTARKMRGCLNWITTNLNKAADATLNSDGTVTGGTARDITTAILNSVLQNVFTSGGKPSIIYCGAFQKGKLSQLAYQGTNYRSIIEDKTLETAIDVYVSDFGQLKIVPHRGMPTDVILILSPKYWKKATLRPTGRRKLAKTGDSEMYDITVEHTLMAMAEQSSGRITNLTTS